MLINILQAILFGIVEGITEWLPVSSTGHLIILDEIVKINMSKEFWDFFLVAIQLGAILAVIVIYFKKLNPWDTKKSRIEQTRTWYLLGNIMVACIPAAGLGVLLNDQLDKIYNFWVVAIMLIVYGVLFIILENHNNKKEATYQADFAHYQAVRKDGKRHHKPKSNFKYQHTYQLTTKVAFYIGIIQCLSLVPGTSRSGVTILGSMIIGCNRKVAAEFSFFLAIPIMIGASLYKGYKLVETGYIPNFNEYIILAVGIIVAFLVSFFVIKNLLKYIKKHDFKLFGWYRIALGVVVLAYFLIGMLVK